jgi:hypothetical protein
MLMLIDSGSTSSFIDLAMVNRLGLIPQPRAPMFVKVANGERLLYNSVLLAFAWFTHGTTFKHDMLVIDMGGYDAVLGIDWLQQFRPMNCDWEAKWIEFPYKGTTVRLQGVVDQTQDHLTEILIEQVIKLHANNELWATAILEHESAISVLPIPESVKELLQQFPPCSKNQLTYLLQGALIMLLLSYLA